MNDDLISRQAAIKAINDTLHDYIPTLVGRDISIPLECGKALADLPSVTPKQTKTCYQMCDKWQRTGHWIQSIDGLSLFFKCDKCGFYKDYKKQTGWNYCPNCGTKMGEQA